MSRKLVAAVACRNQGARLYGKPLQNLDIEGGYRIIDNVVGCLQSIDCIDEVVLGISEGVANEIYLRVAEELGVRYILGNETDVLGRLICCGHLAEATDIFRVSSESPFLYFEEVEEHWKAHISGDLDATLMDNIIDGCGYEILSMSALERSHRDGEDKHRSELCSLYIRENNSLFKTSRIEPPHHLQRTDLRLTVDLPEDLVLCRGVYKALGDQAPRVSVGDIVEFLDANPGLIELTKPFTEAGYATMFVWNENDS